MIIIKGIEVRERNGLYCLNDIHRVSGGLHAYKPNRFLDLKSTKRLIEYLSGHDFVPGQYSCLVDSVQEGRALNTYAHKYVVYSYAMWIDVAFHVAVVACFDAVANEEIDKAKAIAKDTLIKANAMDRMCNKANKITITQATGEIFALTGVILSPQRLNLLLREGGYKLRFGHWYNNHGGGWKIECVNSGLTDYKYGVDQCGNKHGYPCLTSRGVQYLAEYLNRYYCSHPLRK